MQLPLFLPFFVIINKQIKRTMNETMQQQQRATPSLKAAIEKAVKEGLEKAGVTLMEANKTTRGREKLKQIGFPCSISTFYNMVAPADANKSVPSRKSYLKACEGLGIKVNKTVYPLDLARKPRKRK